MTKKFYGNKKELWEIWTLNCESMSGNFNRHWSKKQTGIL